MRGDRNATRCHDAYSLHEPPPQPCGAPPRLAERKLMDMRRSGVVEACRRTNAVGLSAKLANSIGRSNALHKAYAPVDIEAVRNTDVARLHGRRKMREANGKGAKV